MTITPFDLLREKRQELGLPEPSQASSLSRGNLVKGTVIGSVVAGVALGVGALVTLRSVFVAREIEQLATVEAEVEQYETRLRSEKAALSQADAVNKSLVDGLLSVRSGSALLRDLQLRVPDGVQLTEARQPADGKQLTLKGQARDPKPFESINALQLQLKRSPLVDPASVSLKKAAREQPQGQQAQPGGGGRPVTFELALAFRPAIAPLAEKQILEQLGSEGLARRLTLLQKEGLLR
jgi:type IV pilus assembly protein PilN